MTLPLTDSLLPVAEPQHVRLVDRPRPADQPEVLNRCGPVVLTTDSLNDQDQSLNRTSTTSRLSERLALPLTGGVADRPSRYHASLTGSVDRASTTCRRRRPVLSTARCRYEPALSTMTTRCGTTLSLMTSGGGGRRWWRVMMVDGDDHRRLLSLMPIANRD